MRRYPAAEPVRCPPAAGLPHSRSLTWAPAPTGETVEPPPAPQLHFMYVAVVASVLLFFVGCGVLLSRKRRRQHGQLWFPEGFKVSEASKKKRREPLGEDSVGLKSVDAAAAPGVGEAGPANPWPWLTCPASLGPRTGAPAMAFGGATLSPASPNPQAPEERLGWSPHGRQPERVG